MAYHTAGCASSLEKGSLTMGVSKGERFRVMGCEWARGWKAKAPERRPRRRTAQATQTLAFGNAKSWGG